MSSRQVVRSAGGRVVGEVAGDTLVKHVRGSIHLLREPRGWAVDTATLEEAERLGARSVLIVDKETGERWRASTSAVWEHGVKVNRGFGSQVALPLAFWHRTPAGAEERVQLTLWEGAG